MNGIDTVAELMVISAITAPKSRGQNYVCTQVLKGEVLKELAEAMVEFGERKKKNFFDRDARNVAESEAVVLIGLKDAAALGLNCGACGFPDCASLNKQPKQTGEFAGPICALRQLDMGIAIGSAVKTASIFNVDNRVMYRIGPVVREMKLVDWDFVMGIPISVSGKSIYYDR